jgi:tetratricopeptide (TPR) repeat protein
MKRFLAAWALMLASAALFGASEFFDKGQALFVQNKPQDARPLLESALNDDPANEMTYLYLGIIYQQLGNTQQAIDVLKKGLAVASAYKELFYYNIGNDLFSRKDFALAEEMYSSAITSNKDMPDSYLNRANTRMQVQNLDGALSDYTLFLQLAPQDPQRPAIEKLIALLRKVQDDKVAAAQADEARKAAELAKQKALMNDVLNSLNNAGDSTKNLSVDSINGQTQAVDVDIKD